jgi:hypothetical protein
MNNARVDITSHTIEINTMYGATRTVWYLHTSNIGLERVDLSRFSLRFKNLDVFLVHIRHLFCIERIECQADFIVRSDDPLANHVVHVQTGSVRYRTRISSNNHGHTGYATWF